MHDLHSFLSSCESNLMNLFQSSNSFIKGMTRNSRISRNCFHNIRCIRHWILQICLTSANVDWDHLNFVPWLWVRSKQGWSLNVFSVYATKWHLLLWISLYIISLGFYFYFFMFAILSEEIWLYATPSESNSQFLDLQVKQTIPISQIYSIKDSHRVT